MGLRTIPTAELRAECVTLERGVLRAGLASPDELAPWTPGGESNTSTDARGWLAYFARLHRFHARGEQRGALALDPHDRNDLAVMDALRNEPVAVRLIEPVTVSGPEGETRYETVYVYAKSLDALLAVHALDRTLAKLLLTKLELEGAFGPTSELLTRVVETISYTYQLLVWIVTSAGPELPYASDTTDPVPPIWIQRLQAWDVVRICQAMQEHQLRLAALSALVDVKAQSQGGTRPSWSMFIGSMAVEMQQSPNMLMKHRALLELLATAHLATASRTPPAARDAA